MPETNNHGFSLKEYTKMLASLAVFFAFIWGITEGLWLFDKLIIVSVMTVLVPIKFFVIIFRSRQLFYERPKKIFLIVITGIFLFAAFLFDVNTIPNLWAYLLGSETEGKAIKFTIKSKITHFIMYEFSVDKLMFTKEQQVSIPFYESYQPGSFIPLRYLPNNPNVSCIVDPKELKFQALLAFYVSFGIIYSLFVNVIEQKAALIMESFLAREQHEN